MVYSWHLDLCRASTPMNKSPTTIERPPIVAVLGHVDHGKSTLLDFIRKTNVVSSEAGGITQHVAAYEAAHRGKRITFIDTPGHAAFKAIRARGATAADVCILVVAADDGVKPQTLEALESIKSAGTPFVVAINKIDKPNADLGRTQASLLEHGIYLEQFGGEVPWAAISAKTGQGVDELLDLILIVAEVEELTGDPEIPAQGYVIEAHRDGKRGIAATLIIRNGTLSSGMAVHAGPSVAPVRLMEDHKGRSLQEATFSTPVQLIGFDELPEVGSEFQTYAKKRQAEMARDEWKSAHITIPIVLAEQSSDMFLLPIIVRADTTGSLEAIALEVSKLGVAHRRVMIVQSGIGAINEGDVKQANSGSPRAVVIGFNTTADSIALALAERDQIKVETFSIIYKLTERLEELLIATAPKRSVELSLGKARILKVFSNKHDEYLVGASVLEGSLSRTSQLRSLRHGEIIGTGKILSIQKNKQVVDKVEQEGEFGTQITLSAEPLAGDIIETFSTSMQ